MGIHLDYRENTTRSTREQYGHNPVTLARHLYLELGWAFILASFIARLYSTTAGITLWISTIFLAAILFLPTKGGRMRPQALDGSVLILCAFEIPSLLFSQYHANSIRSTVTILIFALTYYVVRLTIRTCLQVTFFSGLLGLGGGCLALSGLSQFDENAKRLGATGLTNLVAFRSRLISPPSPWIPGEWFTVLLLALPFACAVPAYFLCRQQKWLAAVTLVVPVLIALTLCLSLSRAVFWGIVLFCFLLIAFQLGARLTSMRAAATLFGTALVALVLILATESVLYTSLLSAYSGQHASQIRSTRGRFEIWNRSLGVFQAHPLWGVGSGNAALALTSTADQEEKTGFASRTFSLPLQILVEKGIVGFLIYCSFLILVAREFMRTVRYSPPETIISPKEGCKKNGAASSADCYQSMLFELSAHKAMACCFAAGLVAVLFRELTYSSLFEHPLTLALVAVLSALLCISEQGK